MKNNITELVFILDKSGSMSGLETDVIGGFNSLITKQRAQPGACYISTVLFSDSSQVLHDRLPLYKIKNMSQRDFTVSGCTALIDAIGGAIHHIETVHKYIRPEDVPEHTTFVIMTDGMENASRSYNSRQVKEMIETKKKYLDWEFLFIGANIDAVETAENIGIEANRAVNYHADSTGTEVAFNAVNNAVCCQRRACPIPEDWGVGIDDDYQSRK